MLYYDYEVFKKFKDKSVKSLLEFVPGKTYYRNYGTDFIFNNLAYCDGIVDGKWDARITEVRNTRENWLFARDVNIGAHYNPWLVFKNKQDAEDCEKELKVHYFDAEPEIIEYDFYEDDYTY